MEYECLACGIEIVDKIFNDKTQYKLKSDEESMHEFLSKMDRLVTQE